MEFSNKQKEVIFKNIINIAKRLNDVEIEISTLNKINKRNIQKYLNNVDIEKILYECYDNIELKLMQDTNFNTLLWFAELGIDLSYTLIADSYYYEGYPSSNLEEAFKWYSKAAKQNDHYVQFTLGYMYYSGEGVEKNLKEAYHYFTLAMNQGDVFSKYNIALMHMNGEYVESNFEKALKLFCEVLEDKKIDKELEIETKQNIATINICGLVDEPDYEIAVEYLKEASEYGCLGAKNSLGLLYMQGIAVPTDLEKAKTIFLDCLKEPDVITRTRELAIYNGVNPVEMADDLSELSVHALACVNLGSIYYQKEEYELAFKYFEKATKLGSKLASLKLGLLYDYGEGVEQDLEKAEEYYFKSFNDGYKIAALQLASMYFVNDLKEEAVFHYAKIAYENNIFGSSLLIGYLYYYGFGVEQSYEQASIFFKEAADDGVDNANFELAEMYKDGIYFLKSIRKALKYYELELENNPKNADAHYEIGSIYYNNEEIPQDLKKAKYHLEKAYHLGYNCEYTLELVNSALNEDLELNFVHTLYKESSNLDEFLNKIKDSIYDQLDINLINIIEPGFETYYSQLKRHEDDLQDVDFSASATPFIKSLESLIKNKIIMPYKKYLEDTNIDNIKLTKFHKFTLGNFKEFLSIKEKKFTRFDLNDRLCSESVIYFADSELLSFLMNNVFDKNKFDGNGYKEHLIGYLNNFVKVVNQINSFRILAVHDGIININSVETIINYLFLDKKVILDFVNKMK